MENLLRSAESLDDEPATLQALINRNLGVSPDILQKMARDLWGFLNLNLQGSARDWVNNSTPLEGFALWQRVVKAIRSRNEIRRHELVAKVQRPEMASNLREVPVALERWEHYTATISSTMGANCPSRKSAQHSSPSSQ